MGAHAFLCEWQSNAEVLQAYALLGGSEEFAIADLVPAERTLLVRFDGTPPSESMLRVALAESAVTTNHSPATVRTHTLSVHYRGLDSALVESHTSLSHAELLEWHTTQDWTVGFLGFAPGFAYLTPSRPLAVPIPRLASPRTRVPRGAVALAGHHCGIYPRESPGGWHIIGQCEDVLWNLDWQKPSLFSPGDTVRFRAVQ